MRSRTKLHKIIHKFVAISALCVLFTTASFSIVSASSANVGMRIPDKPYAHSDSVAFDGVDVSYWNYNIDWKKVKKAGIDYAFIRIGNTYYGPKSLNLDKDSYFETNYKNAKANGIMVGVYYYSAARTKSEAREEAAYVLKKLKGRDLDLPVVCDAEFPSDSRVSRRYYSWRSGERRKNLTDISVAWLDYIENHSDYNAMFYSYRALMDADWSGNKYKMKYIDQKYPVWIAQYSESLGYPRNYEFWQYTSSGRVKGISGYTDCNLWFFHKNDQAVADAGTTSIADCTISLSKSSYVWSGGRKEPSVTVKASDGSILTEGVDYRVNYLKNVKVGKSYAMVSGMGSYSGRTYKTFKITKRSILSNKASSKIAFTACTYNGEYRKPKVKIYYNDKSLKEGTDYKVTYKNNKNAGTATATAYGIGDYGGTITYDFKIRKAEPVFDGKFTYNIPQDKESFKLKASVNNSSDLTYECDNEEIATINKYGKVMITGEIGSCQIKISSAETKNFKAGSTTAVVHVKESLSTIEIDPVTETLVYDGTRKKPETNVYLDGKLLENGVDYKLSYENNINAGTATLIVNGIKKYAGGSTCEFKIKKAKPTFTGKKSYRKAYNAKSFVLDMTSISGTTQHYESDNTNVATVTKSGKVKLTGKIGVAVIKVSCIEGDNYKSGSKNITVRVTKGPATVTTGFKRYTKSTMSKSFLIPATANGDGTLTFTSTNEKIAHVSPSGRVSLTGKAGTVYIKIKTTKTNKWDSGYAKIKLIVSKPDTIKKYISATEKTLISLSGKKVRRNGVRYVKLSYYPRKCKYFVDGYEIYHSRYETHGFKKVSTVKEKTCLNKVSKGKTYYYKVRGYRIIDGKMYRTRFSAVKNFKFKK